MLCKETNLDILASGDLVLTLISLDTISQVSESFVKKLEANLEPKQVF